jgi:tetratricopeptide (TPR) repeat protein
VPAEIDALVTLMLAKDAAARPSASAVYDALLPFALAAASWADGFRGVPGDAADQGRDPTWPFRRPLLAAPTRSARTDAEQALLTDAEAKLLLGNVDALLRAEHPAEAINLLEDAAGRAPDAAYALELRRALAAALLYAGEYTRAATLFDAAGSEYRRYLPATDPLVLGCAYQAGYAYAETGKPDKALPQLRYYVQNADPGQDAEDSEKIIESRFLIAQMLASSDPEAAAAELRALRPLLADTFGADSTQVRNLDKQVSRLRTPS